MAIPTIPLSSVRYPDGKTAEIASASYKPTAVSAEGRGRRGSVQGGLCVQRGPPAKGDGIRCGGHGICHRRQFRLFLFRRVRPDDCEITEPKDTAEGETENRVVQTVIHCDDDGGVVSQYMVWRTAAPAWTEEKKRHQPYAGGWRAGVVSNADNLLLNHGFMDDTLSGWNGETGNDEALLIKGRMRRSRTRKRQKGAPYAVVQRGMHGQRRISGYDNAPGGEYAFSAYLRVLSAFSGGNCPGAYLRVTKPDGTVLAESERLTKYDADYVRLIAPFTLGTAQSVRVHILADGAGTVYADAAQLENNRSPTPTTL